MSRTAPSEQLNLHGLSGFETLPTAIVAFVEHYRSVHGHPPPGVVPPEPPEAPIID